MSFNVPQGGVSGVRKGNQTRLVAQGWDYLGGVDLIAQMYRGSIGAVGRWWIGGVGVEPHPFRRTVGHAAITEITDGIGPVNRINSPPNFIILGEDFVSSNIIEPKLPVTTSLCSL